MQARTRKQRARCLATRRPWSNQGEVLPLGEHLLGHRRNPASGLFSQPDPRLALLDL
ncbi:MAG: hypothetical protein ABW128_20805 [Rhizorhabdus sp.]